MVEAGSGLNRIELEQERKRVRSVLKSAEGRQALRDELGLQILFAGEAQAEGKPIVATLIPSHSGPKPQTVEAFERMVQSSRQVCTVAPQPSISSSVVHWVRNNLLDSLYKSGKPFDYVLFMDDDIVPPPDALTKLLAHKVDIVAGACTVRQDPPLPNFRSYDPERMQYHTAFEWQGDGLVQVGAVGTGFMLISKEALTKIADYYLNCRHEKEFLGMSEEVAQKTSDARWDYLKRTHNAWWFEFLKQPKGDGEFGEDISFCFKAMQCGIPIYVDTTVKCGHIGSYAFSLDDYEAYREGLIAAQKVKEQEPAILVTD